MGKQAKESDMVFCDKKDGKVIVQVPDVGDTFLVGYQYFSWFVSEVEEGKYYPMDFLPINVDHSQHAIRIMRIE